MGIEVYFLLLFGDLCRGEHLFYHYAYLWDCVSETYISSSALYFSIFSDLSGVYQALSWEKMRVFFGNAVIPCVAYPLDAFLPHV